MRAIDRVIASIKAAMPGMAVRQLQVAHPGDDSGLWFFTHPGSRVEVNVESSDGEFPFLIENSENGIRMTTTTDEDTIAAVSLVMGIQRRTIPGSTSRAGPA